MWVQYYAVEPWGMAPDDYRWSMLYASIAAALGVKDFDPSKMTVGAATAAAEEAMSGEGATVIDDEGTLDRLFGIGIGAEE